jgi:hypothetical protein
VPLPKSILLLSERLPLALVEMKTPYRRHLPGHQHVRAHINIDESGKRERLLGAVEVSTDQRCRTQNPALSRAPATG